MQFFRMIALALLAGSIGAGAVWYGWGLIENARSLVRNRSAGIEVESEEQGGDGDTTQRDGDTTQRDGDTTQGVAEEVLT